MSDFYLCERIMQLRVEEEHRQAAGRSLQKLAGQGRRSWLAQQRYQVLRWLGDALVRYGQQLLDRVPQPPPGIQGPEGHRA